MPCGKGGWAQLKDDDWAFASGRMMARLGRRVVVGLSRRMITWLCGRMTDRVGFNNSLPEGTIYGLLLGLDDGFPEGTM